MVATVLRTRGNTPRVAGTALAGAPPAVREFGHLADDLFAIGLDLGGRSPHETPVAIMAEVVAVRHGGTGRPLTDREGPIHQRAAPA